MPEHHAPGQPALRATACTTKVLSSERCLTRTSPSSSRKAARPADAAQLPDTRGRCNLGKPMPGPAVQPHTGQAADQIANTLRNSRAHPSRSCYSYCMISPIRGNRTGFPVQVPPRTPKPGKFPAKQTSLEHAGRWPASAPSLLPGRQLRRRSSSLRSFPRAPVWLPGRATGRAR